MRQSPPPPGWENPKRIKASISYRDRTRPEDDAWPLEVSPDPRAAVQTVARTTPAQHISAISERLGLVSVDYVERIIAMVIDSGTVLATSHTYLPATLDGYQNDDSWRLAALGQFALPGVNVTLVSKQMHARFPTHEEAAAFAIPVECSVTEICCAMVIGTPFAVRAGLIVLAPGFTPVKPTEVRMRVRDL